MSNTEGNIWRNDSCTPAAFCVEQMLALALTECSSTAGTIGVQVIQTSATVAGAGSIKMP